MFNWLYIYYLIIKVIIKCWQFQFITVSSQALAIISHGYVENLRAKFSMTLCVTLLSILHATSFPARSISEAKCHSWLICLWLSDCAKIKFFREFFLLQRWLSRLHSQMVSLFPVLSVFNVSNSDFVVFCLNWADTVDYAVPLSDFLPNLIYFVKLKLTPVCFHQN